LYASTAYGAVAERARPTSAITKSNPSVAKRDAWIGRRRNFQFFLDFSGNHAYGMGEKQEALDFQARLGEAGNQKWIGFTARSLHFDNCRNIEAMSLPGLPRFFGRNARLISRILLKSLSHCGSGKRRIFRFAASVVHGILGFPGQI